MRRIHQMISMITRRGHKELASFVQGLTGAHLVWTVYIGQQLTCYVRLGMWGYLRSYLMGVVWQGHIDKWGNEHVRVVYCWRRRRHS